MSLQKNVASQKWIVFAFDRTDNTPVSGDAAQITANLRLDGGAANAVDDTNPTELEDGFYVFDITQAESNADLILMTPESSTGDVQVIGVPGAVYTSAPNSNALGIESDGDLTKVNLCANTTLVDTTTNNTDVRGTDSAATAASLATAQLDLDTITGADGVNLLSATQASIDAIETDTGTTLQAELDAIQAAVITNAAGVDIAADIIAIKAETATILVDTGTTLQAELDAIQAAVITNAAGVDIAADIIAVKAETAAILVDTGTTLQAELDAIQAAVITNATGVDIAADIIAMKAETVLILADTADIQPKLGTPAADVSADIAAVKVDTASTLVDTSVIGAAGAGLTDLGGMSTGMKAEVNAEVDTALVTTTYAEPGQGTPSATLSLKDKIGYLFKAWRNRSNQTATTYQLFNDDATTVDHKATVSDDTATAEKGEVATGP